MWKILNTACSYTPLYRLQCILEYLPTEGKIGNIKVKKDNSNFVNFFLRWREDQGMA